MGDQTRASRGMKQQSYPYSGIEPWSKISTKIGNSAIENNQPFYGNTCNTQYIGDVEKEMKMKCVIVVSLIWS